MLNQQCQISALLDIQAWNSKNEQARIADQLVLNGRLDALEANQNLLMKELGTFDRHTRSMVITNYGVLDANASNMKAMMASLHRRLAQHLPADREHVVDREHAFFTHSLQLLTTVSGEQIESHSWTITSYEVDFGRKIGSGGLYELSHIMAGQSTDIFISGKVFEGKWNRTNVAIKVLPYDNGITPSPEVCVYLCPATAHPTPNITT